MLFLKRQMNDNISSHHAYLFGTPQVSSHLRHVTIENVLAGHTCSPIGLADFEAYLSFAERSLQNLQFVVWYQSYRQRFFAAPATIRALSPGKTVTEFSFNAKADPDYLARQGTASSLGTQSFGQSTVQGSACDFESTYHDDPLRSPSSWPSSPDTAMSAHPLVHAFPKGGMRRVSTTPASPYEMPIRTRQDHQFGRTECERIVATFFSPKSRKELLVDPSLRNTVLGELETNTHPDVFLPVYEAVFITLKTRSLPRFLISSSAVTNRPNQIGYLLWGLLWCIITVIIFPATLVFAPWDDFRSRALRLVIVLPACIGTSFIYASYRGYCLNISGRRKNMQLRPWELEAAGTVTPERWGSFFSPAIVTNDAQTDDELEDKVEDAETGNARSQTLVPDDPQNGTTGVLPAQLARIAARQARKRREAMLIDVSVSIIAPFTGQTILRQDSASSLTQPKRNSKRPGPGPLVISFTQQTVTMEDCETPTSNYTIMDKHVDSLQVGGHRTVDDDLMTIASVTQSQSNLTRSSSISSRRSKSTQNSLPTPAIYGPEKVVLDPRIQAVHTREFLKITAIIIATFLISSVACLTVPVIRVR